MPKPSLTVAEGSSGLRIEHLRKSYRKKTVIRDFSMTLDRGEVVALLGKLLIFKIIVLYKNLKKTGGFPQFAMVN